MLEAEQILNVSDENRPMFLLGLIAGLIIPHGKFWMTLTKIARLELINVFDQQNKEAAAAIGHPVELVENWMYANSIHLVDYLPLLAGAKLPISTYFDNHNPISGCRYFFFKWRFWFVSSRLAGAGAMDGHCCSRYNRYELAPLEKLTIQKRGERVKNEWVFEARASQKEVKPGLFNQASEMIRFVKLGKQT